MTRVASPSLAAALALVVWTAPRVQAHSGPPFPIVSNQIVGAYDISIWTDPDVTDDGKPAGQFWVVLKGPNGAAAIPAGTRVNVAIRATDGKGPERAGAASPVDGLVSRQFVALLMDHEARYAVRVTVDGPLGHASTASEVDGTYDLRPAPFLLVVYLFPFIAIGVLWVKLMRRRRQVTPRP